MNESGRPERRKHPRESVRYGAYAAISPLENKLGQIVDISMGGLAFEYIDNTPSEQFKGGQMVRLGGQGSSVADLPFRVVEDQSILQYSPFSFLAIRKVRLQFEALAPEQMFLLERYIRENAREWRSGDSVPGSVYNEMSQGLGVQRMINDKQ